MQVREPYNADSEVSENYIACNSVISIKARQFPKGEIRSEIWLFNIKVIFKYPILNSSPVQGTDNQTDVVQLVVYIH